MRLLLNPQKDFNHLHIIIKIELNIVPLYVPTPVQSQVNLYKVITVQCTRKRDSSSALFFPGEVLVYSSVIVLILSIDRSLNNKHSVITMQIPIDRTNFKLRHFNIAQVFKKLNLLVIITFFKDKPKDSWRYESVMT